MPPALISGVARSARSAFSIATSARSADSSRLTLSTAERSAAIVAGSAASTRRSRGRRRGRGIGAWTVALLAAGCWPASSALGTERASAERHAARIDEEWGRIEAVRGRMHESERLRATDARNMADVPQRYHDPAFVGAGECEVARCRSDADTGDPCNRHGALRLLRAARRCGVTHGSRTAVLPPTSYTAVKCVATTPEPRRVILAQTKGILGIPEGKSGTPPPRRTGLIISQ